MFNQSHSNNSSEERSSHHREVEASHDGELRDLAGGVSSLTDIQSCPDALTARGVLHVLQTLRPGRRADQPQEDQDGRQHKILKTRTNKRWSYKLVPPVDNSRWNDDQYSQKWDQSQSPCRRACSRDKPTAPPCCRGSRQRPRPQRTPMQRSRLPPWTS